ncbi:hypothetical protein HC031_05065 [Planosporangium thailandense]|uniref:Uncharacterized protein n=1 Tax=Planosporangium thailandense TaxID=765197 RepID=A0ABX0XV20_9ACTN|nr:hypothetical protein [Planosporangium thailandense]NJC69095.1 hypothetical protein [Planosporangium thailandense]
MTIGGRWRMAGFAVGTGVAFTLTRTYLFDLAPVALALAVSLGVLVGEVVTPRPARARGTASLIPRRMRDYLPKTALATIGLLGAGIAIFAAYPTPDRPDHEVRYFGTAAPVSLVSTLVTLSVVAVLTALAAWLIVRSPQAGVDESERAADEVWRSSAVQRLVYTCAAIFATVFTALGFWYADAQWDWRGGGSPAWGFGLSILAGLGLVTFARYAGTLAFAPPDPRRPGIGTAGGAVTDVVAK